LIVKVIRHFETVSYGKIMVNLNILEGALVSLVFAGYILLWGLKKKQQLSHTGYNPEVIYSDPRPSQRFFALFSRIMTGLVVLLIIMHTVGFENTPGFHRFKLLDLFFLDMAGFLIGILGLSLCLIAQRIMGDSWRVGIDSANRSALITHGVFRLIRNPTYSGLFALCLGVWLIFPTFSFLTWILLFFVMMEFQVRLEEEHLLNLYKDEYKTYLSTTRRYVPFIY